MAETFNSHTWHHNDEFVKVKIKKTLSQKKKEVKKNQKRKKYKKK